MQSNLYFPNVESIFPQLVLSDSIFEWRKNEIEHTLSVKFINIGRKINNRVKENEKTSNIFFYIWTNFTEKNFFKKNHLRNTSDAFKGVGKIKHQYYAIQFHDFLYSPVIYHFETSFLALLPKRP